MADIQTINIGNVVNDGLGDDLRTAFEKVNANFADLNDELSITGNNLGDTGEGIFANKSGSTLNFKNIVAGRKISLTGGQNSIVISNTDTNGFYRLDTDSGSVNADDFENITLTGAPAPTSETEIKDIEVTTSGGVVKFKNIIPVTEFLTTIDFGPINGSFENTLQLMMHTANVDFGTLAYESDITIEFGSSLTPQTTVGG